MTSLGETYEKLMKFIRFFVNRAPGRYTDLLLTELAAEDLTATESNHLLSQHLLTPMIILPATATNR